MNFMLHFRFCFLVWGILLVSPIFAQLPRLDVKQFEGKQISVQKVSVTPLKGTSNGRPYHYIIRDSTIYFAVCDSVLQNSDSTLVITMRIIDLQKTILSGQEMLNRDSLKQFKFKYLTDLSGVYLEPMLDQRLASIEGYFDHIDDSDLAGNEILWTYWSASRYWDLEEIKLKVLQELFWIHLFPGLQPLDEKFWKSSQAMYLNLNMDRVPSKLTLIKEGAKINIQQEIDVVALYGGMVTEDELIKLTNSDPADFFIRVSSEAEYKWNDKLDIPKEIKASITTTLNDEGKKWSKSDYYKIEFIPN